MYLNVSNPFYHVTVSNLCVRQPSVYLGFPVGFDTVAMTMLLTALHEDNTALLQHLQTGNESNAGETAPPPHQSQIRKLERGFHREPWYGV